KPEDTGGEASLVNTLKNFRDVLKTSWVAFLFPMLYGVLEASLNSNFPVFAIRHDFKLSEVTWILPTFSLGAILLQVPIGGLCDIAGRVMIYNILLTSFSARLLMM